MLTSADIRATTFTRTRWREGYDMAEVDAFLARIALAFDTRSGVTALEVINTRFSPTRFREGYSQDQVDDLLDRIAEAVK